MIRLHLFLSLVFLPSIFSDLAADRDALLRLRDAVGGRTRSWNINPNAPCSWEGVKCNNNTDNRVIELRLPGDGLRGQLPPGTIGNLTELRVLSLRKNSLSGELPSDLSSCTLLETLHLQGNGFSGDIPDSLFSLTNLVILNLAGNGFSGSISPGFNRLTNLRDLSLENNAFNGTIPELNNLSGLKKFNVSFNVLTGEIPSSLANSFGPSSFLGTNLCGRPLDNPCPHHHGGDGSSLSGGAVAGITVGALFIFVVILFILFIFWSKFKTRKIQPQIQRSSPTPASPENPEIEDVENPSNLQINPSIDNSKPKEGSEPTISKRATDGLTFFGDDVEVFTLEELLKASAEIIGKGTVGSTYKAYFDSGVEVIVKRLKNVCVSEENFRDKIEEVGSLVRDHLEPLRGYFYGRDEKLLLYEPMPNGSLSVHLHGNKQGPLSWKIRAKIALGAARGIAQIHSVSPGTAHGNIKSSNVFLTDYYNARVSEFGLTQLVSSISSLNGYRAPEVSDTRRTTQLADVYAFGVLILELLTGKAPDRALDEGIVLPGLVETVGPEKWKDEVLDPDLVRFDCSEMEDMMQFMHLAVACTGQSPDRRPSMAEVVGRIEEICG